jgi:hypothetical protein
MSGQLAPFLADDFYYVVDKTSREPERLVLVGGQALEAWGVVLDVVPPTPVVSGGQHFHVLTIDTDWLGQKTGELAEYGSKAAGGASSAEIDWPHTVTVDRIRHKQAKWLMSGKYVAELLTYPLRWAKPVV